MKGILAWGFFIELREVKLRKECNLLEMSIG